MGARFAQHFLADAGAARRMAGALRLGPDDEVIEIGPGKGALTVHLLLTGARVVAIEIDDVLAASLPRRVGAGAERLSVVSQDVLTADWETFPISGRAPVKVAGNLPYNITSPILERLADWPGWGEAVIMVQKEVGERLSAAVGTPAYGALTVGLALVCDAEPLFTLPPEAFRPRPKVHSMVVRLNRKPVPLTFDRGRTRRVVQAAFQQRRKTILNALSHGLGLPKEAVRDVLAAFGVAPERRAETIDAPTFVALGVRLLSGDVRS